MNREFGLELPEFFEEQPRSLKDILTSEDPKIIHITHVDMDGDACVVVMDTIMQIVSDFTERSTPITNVNTIQVNPTQLLSTIESVMTDESGKSPDLIVISDLNFNQDHWDKWTEINFNRVIDDKRGISILVADHHISTLSQTILDLFHDSIRIDTTERIPTADNPSAQTASGASLLLELLMDVLDLKNEANYPKFQHIEEKLRRLCRVVATYDNYDHANRLIRERCEEIAAIQKENDAKDYDYATWRLDEVERIYSVYNALSRLEYRLLMNHIMFDGKDAHDPIYTNGEYLKRYKNGALVDKLAAEKVERETAIKNGLAGAVLYSRTIDLIKYDDAGIPSKVSFGPYVFLILEMDVKYKTLGINTAMTLPEYKDLVDIGVVIDWDRFTATFYTTPDSDINVQPIAKLLGGGGHPHAAGFPISKGTHDWLVTARFNAIINLNPASAIDIPTVPPKMDGSTFEGEREHPTTD